MKTYITILCIVVSFTANAQKVVLGLYPTYTTNVENMPFNYQLKNSYHPINNVLEDDLVQRYSGFSVGVNANIYIKPNLVLYVEEGLRIDEYKGAIKYELISPNNMNYELKETIKSVKSYGNFGLGRVFYMDQANKFHIIPSCNFYYGYQYITREEERSLNYRYEKYRTQQSYGLSVSLNVNARLSKHFGLGISSLNLFSVGYEMLSDDFNNGTPKVEDNNIRTGLGAFRNTRIGLLYYIGKNSDQ